MAVSLKALCYAIYVSAAIACLGSLPWDMVFDAGQKGLKMLRIIRIIHIFSILPYVLVLVVFYKIRDRLDKKKDGPWVVFFAVGLMVTVLGVVGFGVPLISLLAMLGAIWKAREKLKEHEASGQDMPYYDLVGSAGTESSTTGGNVEMIQVAAKP